MVRKIVAFSLSRALTVMSRSVRSRVVSTRSTAPMSPRASPIAEATRAAARQKGRRPTFADIPAVPTDVRGPARIKAVVEAEQRAAAKLRRDAAPETFTLTDTEGYAARARAAAKAPDFGAPTDADRAETEAFAAAARGRASAPSSQPK